jgi:Na+-translocating ferredoxin:NAD+ oxidoreductase RnfD subunit
MGILPTLCHANVSFKSTHKQNRDIVGDWKSNKLRKEIICMATKISSATSSAQDMQDQFFRVTDQVPGAVWYWAAVASIIASATLFLMRQRDWSIFVGQWPPTFLLFGLFHKLVGSPRK